MTTPENPVPRVSVGLPVYNGSNYLAAAIESILAQTFRDFELIICDNASTDATEEICRKYAAADPRIRYSRSETNLGAARNFNRAFELARGEYFKWAAHDDVLAPEFLARCVQALDQSPTAVLACVRVAVIDANGSFIEMYSGRLENMGSSRPEERLGDLLFGQQPCYEVFGLFRSNVLGLTPLIGAYLNSDRNLLVEVSLMGPFVEVPEPLLKNRHHKSRSVSKPRHDRLGWFDTRKEGKLVFPYWREFFEFLRSIHKVPLSWSTRMACWKHMVKWLGHYWRFMRGDLRIAASRVLQMLRWSR